MATFTYNETACKKADRYIALYRHLDNRKFRRLVDQAMDKNDWRVVEIHYLWAEFECRRGGEDGVH